MAISRFIAAKLVGPEGKVYAFEPEPRNISLLQRNVNINGYGNVTLVNENVSNKIGSEKLYLDSIDSGCHTLSPNERSKSSISVSITSLDEFFSEDITIDFIKMDIKGSEEKALQGMERILNKGDVNAMVIEFYPERLQGCGSSPKGLWDRRLTAFGFQIYEIRDRGVRKIDFEQAVQLRQKKEAINLLCLRKKRTNKRGGIS